MFLVSLSCCSVKGTSGTIYNQTQCKERVRGLQLKFNLAINVGLLSQGGTFKSGTKLQALTILVIKK
jgi:hypothetical protein